MAAESVQEVFALTTRGLEGVSAEEMGSLPGLHVREVGYRRIAAVFTGPANNILSLRTVDDVFLDLATWRGVGHQRDELEKLAQRSSLLNLIRAAEVLREFRPIVSEPSFSVTASFVGRRNYSSREISDAVGRAVEDELAWMYRERDNDADLNVRVFVEHETAYVGLRIGETPLHRRVYKVAHVPGSLKPPVAAALTRLADTKRGGVVLDPCCGAGTIVIEAGIVGACAIGGDISADAISAARSNSMGSGVTAQYGQWDARRLPLPPRSADAVVTNLPWGREVEVDASLAVLYGPVLAEVERVLADGGRVIALTDSPGHVCTAGLQVRRRMGISLFGSTPTIVVLERQV